MDEWILHKMDLYYGYFLLLSNNISLSTFPYIRNEKKIYVSPLNNYSDIKFYMHQVEGEDLFIFGVVFKFMASSILVSSKL